MIKTTYSVPWDHPELELMLLFRVKTHPTMQDFWVLDESVGVMKDGTVVTVIVGLENALMVKGSGEQKVDRFILDRAREDKVYAAGLGFFEEGVIKYGDRA